MGKARTIEVTAEGLLARWNELFDRHPWLDGLSGACGDVFCCPNDPEDWLVLSEVSGLLFLAGGDRSVKRLSRGLVTAETLGSVAG